jgi:hypothetical protein
VRLAFALHSWLCSFSRSLYGWYCCRWMVLRMLPAVFVCCQWCVAQVIRGTCSAWASGGEATVLTEFEQVSAFIMLVFPFCSTWLHAVNTRVTTMHIVSLLVAAKQRVTETVCHWNSVCYCWHECYSNTLEWQLVSGGRAAEPEWRVCVSNDLVVSIT